MDPGGLTKTSAFRDGRLGEFRLTNPGVGLHQIRDTLGDRWPGSGDTKKAGLPKQPRLVQ